MFYYISGELAHIEQNLAVIDAHGVGYACHTSLASLATVNVGDKVKFYTYLHVREDVMDLYGFADANELNFFKMLISVSGVGPKAALSILSAVTPDQLALAIATEDEKPLLAASGVGKKMAQKVILELRDKVAKDTIPTAKGVSSVQIASNDNYSEAVAALVALGYSRGEVDSVLRSMDISGLSTEDIIKKALFGLMR